MFCLKGDGLGERGILTALQNESATDITSFIVSRMCSQGSEGIEEENMVFVRRATALISVVIKALVEMRDKNEIALTIESVRDVLHYEDFIEFS